MCIHPFPVADMVAMAILSGKVARVPLAAVANLLSARFVSLVDIVPMYVRVATMIHPR